MCVNLTIYREQNFSSFASVCAGNLHTSRRTSDQHNWTCEKCSSKSWWHHLYVLSTFHESPRLSATCLGQFRWWKANLQQEKKFHFTLGHLGGLLLPVLFNCLIRWRTYMTTWNWFNRLSQKQVITNWDVSLSEVNGWLTRRVNSSVIGRDLGLGPITNTRSCSSPPLQENGATVKQLKLTATIELNHFKTKLTT